MIRLAVPEISEEALGAVREVLESGWLVQGRHVAAFEDSVADFTGVAHAVAVSSGTAALHAALLALGVGTGDAVAVSAYSYTASANVIEMCGATPVFVDIDPRTFNMDPQRLQEALREAPAGTRFAAIMVVHAFGQMADIDAIAAIAAEHGLPVVEDAACALGATWSGNPPGTGSRAACYSFHPRKAITTGEGGMVVTNDEQLAEVSRAVRNHGLDPSSPTPEFIMPGLNYRMTEFQAVLGSTSMRGMADNIVRRRNIAERYDQLLTGVVLTPLVPPASGHVFQSYVTLLSPAQAEHRAEIIKALAERGVESNIGTWAMPTTSFYRRRYGYTETSFPVTSDVFARSLSLPMHERISPDDQQQVATALAEVLAAL